MSLKGKGHSSQLFCKCHPCCLIARHEHCPKMFTYYQNLLHTMYFVAEWLGWGVRQSVLSLTLHYPCFISQ
jgi:hypothetical protein